MACARPVRRSARRQRSEQQAAAFAAALAEGGAAEREAVYAEIEQTVRASGAEAVALAKACAPPLLGVLCAPLAKVDAEEFQRASLLVVEMLALDPAD